MAKPRVVIPAVSASRDRVASTLSTTAQPS
jgi:hypothetical protein